MGYEDFGDRTGNTFTSDEVEKRIEREGQLAAETPKESVPLTETEQLELKLAKIIAAIEQEEYDQKNGIASGSDRRLGQLIIMKRASEEKLLQAKLGEKMAENSQ